MSDILKKICDVKVQEVAAAKNSKSLSAMRADAESRRPFGQTTATDDSKLQSSISIA